MNYEKIFKIVGDIATGISLVAGIAGLGFKAKDAFAEHSEAKEKLVDAQAEELSEESVGQVTEEFTEA